MYCPSIQVIVFGHIQYEFLNLYDEVSCKLGERMLMLIDILHEFFYLNILNNINTILFKIIKKIDICNLLVR